MQRFNLTPKMLLSLGLLLCIFSFYFDALKAQAATPAFVSAVSGEIYNNSPGDVSTPAQSVISGNALIVYVGTGADVTGTATLSDTAGNSYTRVTAASATLFGRSITAFYALNVVGHAANVVTADINITGYAEIVVMQFSGIATSNALEAATATTGSGTSLTSPAFSTIEANEVSVAAVRGVDNDSTRTFTAGSEDGGYTIPSNGVPGAGACACVAAEYNLFSSTKTNTATTINASSDLTFAAMGVMTFKADSGAPTPPPPPPPPDITAPVISGIAASGITETGALVSWTTDEAADSQIDYGLTTAYGSQTTLNTSLVTSHSQSLSGLSAGTLYNYRIRSRDAAGNLAISTNNTFTTAAASPPPPAPPPSPIGGCSAANVRCVPSEYPTIQACANVAVAGDTCLVSSGVYHEQVNAQNSGTAGNLIVYKANPGDTVVVTGDNTRTFGFNTTGKNYIRIEGFEITAFTGHGILVDWSGAGIGSEIVGNHIHNGGGNPDTAGVYYTNFTNGLIENNHLHDLGGDGILFVGSIIGNITIRGNHIHDNQTDGMKGGGPGTILIENNNIYRMTNAVNHGDCMQLMGMTGTLIVRNNTTWDCTQDIYTDDYSFPAGIAPWGDVYIYNNLVYNSQAGSTGLAGFSNGIVTGSRFNNWSSVTIVGNTVVDLNNGSGGIAVADVSGGAYTIGTVRVFNNLFYNSINVVDPAPFSNLQMDYNVYFNQYRSWYMGTGWTTLPVFQSRYPMLEQHSRYSDVPFVSYAYPNPDFHLVSGSLAALDTGIPVAPVGAISFDFDKDSASRPQGVSWDIGAYEYVSGSPSPPPPPPAPAPPPPPPPPPSPSPQGGGNSGGGASPQSPAPPPSSGSEAPPVGPHPSGTLINQNGTIFLIENAQKRGFRNPPEYFSHGYRFSQAVSASPEDRALPEGPILKALDGTLSLDTTDNRTIYMIAAGAKRGFTSAEVFFSLGYQFSQAIPIDLSDYPAGTPIFSGSEVHPDGALILDKTDNRTVWWVLGSTRQGFESAEVFFTYGWEFAKIVPANDADMLLPQGSLVKFRDGTLVDDQGTYFIISGGQKRRFVSLEQLQSRGYDVGNMISANLSLYIEGSVVE